jgi:hypothetical protein
MSIEQMFTPMPGTSAAGSSRGSILILAAADSTSSAMDRGEIKKFYYLREIDFNF